MPTLLRSLVSGAAGAVALTLLHESARRRVPEAPRMDLVAMRGLRRLLPALREPGMPEDELHRVALAGDLLSNSLYYAAIPASTAGGTWTRALLLGAIAGVGALVVPEPAGLGAPPHSGSRANQLMTVAWYMAGAMTTALVASVVSDHSEQSH